MTEMSPVGTVGAPPANWDAMSDDEQVAYMSRPGRSMFGVELRIVDDDGKVLPRDGKSSGHLADARRGGRASAISRRTRTASTQTIGSTPATSPSSIPTTTLRLTDRAKDVIKSGGEWISSIELENAAVGCPGVAEAAAIGIPHPKWDERPLLLIVRDDGSNVVRNGNPRFPRRARSPNGGLPDAIEFVEELPHTATGKLSKKDLRDKYRDYRFANAEAMVGRD